jgi:hypothetical protein
MSNQLIKACPFCGSDECVVDLDLPAVMCENCSATGPSVSEQVQEEAESDAAIERDAIRVWNARRVQ